MSKKRLTSLQSFHLSTWKECLERFLESKTAQGKADLTLQDYERHITSFFSKYDTEISSPDLERSLYDYLSDPAINIDPKYIKRLLELLINQLSRGYGTLH